MRDESHLVPPKIRYSSGKITAFTSFTSSNATGSFEVRGRESLAGDELRSFLSLVSPSSAQSVKNCHRCDYGWR